MWTKLGILYSAEMLRYWKREIMAKKNDNNFKKAMNELLGAPAVKEETAKPAAKEVVKETVKEEPKKAAPVVETAKPAAKVKRE